MRTIPYSDILNTAAESVGRTRDRVPQSEQVSLQGFITGKLRTVWNLCVWPDMISWPALNVQVVNHSFSKNEGAAAELGDILGYYDRQPLRLDERPNFDFQEGNGVVLIDSHCASVWVLALPPTPNLMAYNANSNPTLLAYPVPEEFANYLGALAGYKLAVADNQYTLAQVLKAEAQEELVGAQNRAWDKLPVWLKRPRFTNGGRHRRPGHVPGFAPVGYTD